MNKQRENPEQLRSTALEIKQTQRKKLRMESKKKRDEEEKLMNKIDAGDKEKIEMASQDALDWLDKNRSAAKDEIEAKKKEVERIVVAASCQPDCSKHKKCK